MAHDEQDERAADEVQDAHDAQEADDAQDEQSWPVVPATPGCAYWIVSSGLLADEPARRSFINHVRRQAARRGHRGRIRFRRSEPNPVGVEMGMPTVHWIEALP